MLEGDERGGGDIIPHKECPKSEDVKNKKKLCAQRDSVEETGNVNSDKGSHIGGGKKNRG